MSASAHQSSPFSGAKGSRLVTLLGEILADLDRSLRQSKIDGDISLPAFSLETAIEAASYLHQLGLTPSAARLRKAADELMCSTMFVLLSDFATGKPLEIQDELEDKFGPYPRPAENPQEHEQRQRDRQISILGRTCQMAAFVRQLRDHLLKWGAPAPAQVEGESSTEQKRKERMTAEKANQEAMNLAMADHNFVHLGKRGWADKIGCSEGLVSKLPLWQATMKKTGRGLKGKPRRPKVASLTHKMLETIPDPRFEQTAGEGDDETERQAELDRLMAEQKADWEPSPLDDSRRTVREHKRL